MEDQHKAEMNLEMDIADFSGKTVQRIDIQNVVSRADHHTAGIAIVMSFTDGATGTILVRSREAPIIATPYARPRMAGYLVDQEDAVVQVP
jgi:hypothetical protein